MAATISPIGFASSVALNAIIAVLTTLIALAAAVIILPHEIIKTNVPIAVVAPMITPIHVCTVSSFCRIHVTMFLNFSMPDSSAGARFSANDAAIFLNAVMIGSPTLPTSAIASESLSCALRDSIMSAFVA